MLLLCTIVLDTITDHDDAEFLLSLRMARHLLDHGGGFSLTTYECSMGMLHPKLTSKIISLLLGVLQVLPYY